MSIQDLGSIGELVGAIATVATLVYLAAQIRANTQAVRSAAAQSVHEAFATWYRTLAVETGLAGIAVRGLRDYASLSEEERARFVATFMAYLFCCQDAFIKWREGSLSPQLWSGWELVMMNLVIPAGGRAFWRERGYLFGEEFRSYVENAIVTREPHPSAKPLGAFSLSGASPAPETERGRELDLRPERFAVARLDPHEGLPDWALSSPFHSLTRTGDELSVVCLQSALPPDLAAERDLRCLAVRGPLCFSETGILQSLADPLARAGVSLFAVSTFDTDYLLVPEGQLPRAIEALAGAGHAVHGSVRGE